MSKFDELKKLAESATPGKWTKRTHARMPSFVQAPRASKDDPYDIEILGEDECIYSTREADVSFIAAANPVAILELLAIRAQLVEALKGLDDSFCSINEFSTKEERHQARMNLIAARAAVAAAEEKP